MEEIIIQEIIHINPKRKSEEKSCSLVRTKHNRAQTTLSQQETLISQLNANYIKSHRTGKFIKSPPQPKEFLSTLNISPSHLL